MSTARRFSFDSASPAARPEPCSSAEAFLNRGTRLRRAVLSPLSAFLLALVWVYRRVISAPLHVLCGPQCGCRYYPTCSDYAADAIRVHGPFLGAWYAVRRLARCNPFHPGGVDFVPPARALRPRCARAA